MIYVLQNNVTFWTVLPNAKKKVAVTFATAELEIWKLLDILKSLLSIIGMKLLLFVLIILS